MKDPLAALLVVMNWARALQGLTSGPLSLTYGDFDDEGYLQTYSSDPFFMTPYYVMKLSLAVTFGAYREALGLAARGREVAHALRGTIWPILLDFLHGIAVASLYEEASEPVRSQLSREVSAQALPIPPPEPPQGTLAARAVCERERRGVRHGPPLPPGGVPV